jgi:hypothetical protein
VKATAFAELVPDALDAERNRLKKLLSGRLITVISDGVTHLGEAYAYTVRSVDMESKCIQHHAVAINHSDDPFDAAKQAALFHYIVHNRIGILYRTAVLSQQRSID